jgi:hypothetical protein
MHMQPQFDHSASAALNKGEVQKQPVITDQSFWFIPVRNTFLQFLFNIQTSLWWKRSSSRRFSGMHGRIDPKEALAVLVMKRFVWS